MKENEKIREDVLRSVSNLTDDQLNQHTNQGEWSIMQVLYHLYLIEKAVVQTIDETIAKGEKRTVEEKPIHLTINRSVKAKAPAFAEPSKEFVPLKIIKEKLAESRKALHEAVEKVDSADLDQNSYPHPVFGALSLSQWVEFVGWHEKRHLEQINELKEALFSQNE
ncbi:MAG TPA: DinB family protein [Chondromyces sp.]|nr:DinB family protein [Chondromyces sp.]